MNFLTTSAFDLPDRLAAKADPALIAGDEQHFAAIAESLEQSIADLSDRLDAELRAPGGIGQEAMDRDMEIHRLAARLRPCVASAWTCASDTWSARTAPSPCTSDGSASPTARAAGCWSTGAPPRPSRSSARPTPTRWAWPAAAGIAGPAAGSATTGTRCSPRTGLDGHAALDDQSAFIASLGSNRSAQMRDVLGTIAADQDAIIRAGSRGALVVDGGPGTGKTVVALHRSAYLLYSDPRLGHRRGGVLFVGPHQPYLAYVADVLPSLGEEGVQTCTLRDLVAEGAAAATETDPDVARLKSSADLVKAIEAAVRFYEKPPAKAMTVETHWSDIWLSADDWAEAFDAPDPGTPHNEARDQIWEELLTILMDKHDGDVPPELLRKSLMQNQELRATFNRAWPLLEPADLVGDLWSVPAYLRMCAPWLSPDDVRALQRADAQAWTVSDLPLLDAARQRLGDPEASRRQRRHDAAVAAEREQMARVVDNLIEVADDEYGVGLVTMLRGEDFHDALVDEAALPGADPDLLAGPFAHIVVDEAQELTDAEWQMLLLALPVPELHHRRGPRPGQARVHRVVAGTARADRARPDHPGLPEHQLPDAGRGHGGSRAGHPGRAPGRQRAGLHPQQRPPRRARTCFGPGLDPRHLARRACRGDRLRHRRSLIPGGQSPGDVPRPVADPGTSEGARVRPSRPHRPAGVRHGYRRSGRPLRRDDPGHPAARHPYQLLTPGQDTTCTNHRRHS